MVEPISVVVAGALGRVGREMIAGLAREADIRVVGGVDLVAGQSSLTATEGGQVPLSQTLGPLLEKVRPRVLVDFTTPEAAAENARQALRAGVSPVVGTTGISEAEIREIGQLAEEVRLGAVIAPNFAIGANLMIHFARQAARFMPAAEIIELHHAAKADAPSGTALSAARAMRDALGAALSEAQTRKFTLEGVRGGEEGGVRIHSVRLPGLVAHHEVIFGGPGQTLTLRHDSTGRESFVPGVAMAVRAVVGLQGLVIGLDRIMGLEP